MKRFTIALVIAASAFGARAESTQELVGEFIGGVTGAVVCSGVGHGRGNTAAVAACGVVGSQIGRAMTRPTPNPYGPPVYQQGSQPQVVYAPMPSQQVIYAQQGYADPCGGDGYFRGVYNPQAAMAYCRGAQEGARQNQYRAERDAYYEGIRNQRVQDAQMYRWGAAGTNN